MQESDGIMPTNGFALSVGKFEASIAVGKKTYQKRKPEDVVCVTLSIPGLYKPRFYRDGKRKVKIEKCLSINVPVSKAYKKQFMKCFKALEQKLPKEKPKIKIIAS